MQLFITFFAPDIKEGDQSPHEDNDRPCPSPWAYGEYFKLLEQAYDADQEECKTCKPVAHSIAGRAEIFA